MGISYQKAGTVHHRPNLCQSQPWQHVGAVTNDTHGPEKGYKCKLPRHSQILQPGLETREPVTFHLVYCMEQVLSKKVSEKKKTFDRILSIKRHPQCVINKTRNKQMDSIDMVCL